VNANARFLRAAEAAVEHWKEALPISVSDSASVKFRVCFPLIANALNHASSGLANISQLPFVAATNARVAFEHALAAQWVLLTHEGEIRLVRHMEYGYLTRAKAFARVTDYPDDLKDIATAEPADGPKRAWSIEMACARFDSSGLLYDIYRNLSQAVHPSYGTLRTHIDIDYLGSNAVRISGSGDLKPMTELPRALGVSSVWAIDVLERLRVGQPNLAKVEEIARAGVIPIDLARDDKKPELQLPPQPLGLTGHLVAVTDQRPCGYRTCSTPSRKRGA
jgi:hypothetical protein